MIMVLGKMSSTKNMDHGGSDGGPKLWTCPSCEQNLIEWKRRSCEQSSQILSWGHEPSTQICIVLKTCGSMHHILTPYENYAFLRDALGYILLCIHLFCILVDLSLPLDTL